MNERPASELLAYARQLVTLSSSEEILTATCREVLALTGAASAVAACSRPGQTWERGIQVQVSARDIHPLTPAGRSALFAIHRRLSYDRNVTDLRRTAETETIFAGLGCAGDLVHVLPIVHRTGRLWGELAVFGPDPIEPRATGMGELIELTTVALENAQRLAFARRDQDRLTLIAEASSDALYDWDFDGRTFWWGGGILKLLGSGADPVEASARWKLERIHEDDRERVRLSLEAARFSKATAWRAEYRFMRADGTYIHVEDHGFFLREVNERAYRMIGSLRDITAMKNLLVREQQARAEAETANRAKDEFLAMLGHELRNPLAPIITGLQLIRLRGAGHLERELTVLERQAQHLIRLVDDLLDISRIAHAKIELKKERLELASAVAAAIETASPLVEGRHHALDVDVPARGLEVEADRARLAQVISNLVTNAAKYTEPGGQLRIRAWRDGSMIALSVGDNGIGIEPDIAPTIFNMFVQERQSLDRSQGGLGLGLSIVRSLVELHGGTVSVRSEGRGRGSEFTIRIPAAPALERAVEAEGRRAKRRGPSGKRILIVDDNEDAADLLAMMLERMGNTIRVAHDPHTALTLIEDFSPDLAVLDIGLPAMDGYELARRLRELPTTKATRLIALTGYGQATDKQRAVDAGFDSHLVKPVVMETLQAAIEKLVS